MTWRLVTRTQVPGDRWERTIAARSARQEGIEWCRSLLHVQRRDTGGLAAGVGGDLLDPGLGLAQQFLAAALQRLAALVDRDRFLQRHLAVLQPLDDSLQLLDRAFEGEFLHVGLGILDHAAVPGKMNALRRWNNSRITTADGMWRAQGFDVVPIRAVRWAATDSCRPCRSYPPSSTETIRPPALASAISISFCVTQPKSPASRLMLASGSLRCASKPAEMMTSSGANFFSCGRITLSNPARNFELPSSGRSGALTMVSCSPRSPSGP